MTMNIKQTAHMMFLAGFAAMVLSLSTCNDGRGGHPCRLGFLPVPGGAGKCLVQEISTI